MGGANGAIGPVANWGVELVGLVARDCMARSEMRGSVIGSGAWGAMVEPGLASVPSAKVLWPGVAAMDSSQK